MIFFFFLPYCPGLVITSEHHSWHWRGCPATGWWSLPSPSLSGFLTQRQTPSRSFPSWTSSRAPLVWTHLFSRSRWVEETFCAPVNRPPQCHHLSVINEKTSMRNTEEIKCQNVSYLQLGLGDKNDIFQRIESITQCCCQTTTRTENVITILEWHFI